jgi:hypothetical protein
LADRTTHGAGLFRSNIANIADIMEDCSMTPIAGYVVAALLQAASAGDAVADDHWKPSVTGVARPLIERCASTERNRRMECEFSINMLALGLFAGGQPKDGCGAFQDQDTWQHKDIPALADWIASHREFETKTEMDIFEAALKALYPCHLSE